MYNKIVSYAEQHNMIGGTGNVVMGLSGGADSVCLLSVLRRMSEEKGFVLHAVHVHHGIRGEEADRDRDFCRKLCEKFNVLLTEYEYDVPLYAGEHGMSSEEAGRFLRYKAFDETADRLGDAVIAVAHHMNDLAETVIFNMCRGSGIRGIRGILPVRGRIIRPLLCCTRDEIEEYIKEQGLDYCKDSTNDGTDYARNRIRHKVIPFLSENINSATVENIASLADNAAKAEEYLEKNAKVLYSSIASDTDGGILLSGLENQDEYMAGRILRMAIENLTGSLKDISESHIKAIMGLLDGQSGRKTDIKNGLMAVKNVDGLFLSPDIGDVENKFVKVEPPCEITPWNGAGDFTFEIIKWNAEQKISNEVYTKCFDYDKIKGGLCLRTRKIGDYIIMDGMGHRKSLKQYFIDAKIPARQRDTIPLLAEGDHVLWVTGGRISEEYKITQETVNVLRVKYGGTDNGES